MNPNQLPPYQPYISSYQNNSINNSINNNMHNNMNNNTINSNNNNINNMAPSTSNYQPSYQPYQSSNQNNYSINRNRLDRAMYTSSIQPNVLHRNYNTQQNNNNNNNTINGLNKLQSLGRFVSVNNTNITDQYKNQSMTTRNNNVNNNNTNNNMSNYNNTNNNMSNYNNTNNNMGNINQVHNNQYNNNNINQSNQLNNNQYTHNNQYNNNNNNNNNQFNQYNNNYQTITTNQYNNNNNIVTTATTTTTKQQKNKMFLSYIQPSQKNNQFDFDRFPAFNLDNNQKQLNNNNNNNNNNNKQQVQQVVEQIKQTAQQRRKRQILAIKQQLQLINKKMQSSNLNKKYTNPNNNNNNNNQPTIYSNTSNYATTTTNIPPAPTNISSFPQRNKSLIAQSMIVSSQSTQGYKFQSIFDKYDSMKKPTYQTYQVKKEQKDTDKPLLLDQFVKKGNTFGNNNINSNNNSGGFNSINSINSIIGSNNNNIGSTSTTSSTSTSSTSTLTTNITSNITTNNTINKYDPIISNPTNTFTKPPTTLNISPTSSNSSSSTNSSIQQTNQQSIGMFKKKKQSTQIQQVTHLSQNNLFDIKNIINVKTITSPKNNQNVLMFKKTKQHTYSQQNYITNTLKKMNIQQSVKFTKQDFVVGKKLGKGQFGQVMLVQHKKTGFLCGMKVMQKKQIRDQKYQGQIARQLSIQFYLSHRNIAPLYGYFQDQKNVYLLVQYCTGGQLLQLLRKNRRMQQPQVSRIIKQIIQGIDYIHKELIIHRDIKPENILFNFGVAKICDFGWAVFKGLGMRKTASVGSPLYYSPEIVMGVEYDEKIDIWDIGMMTYECLLGKIPFRIYSELDLNRIVEDQIKFPEYIDTTDQAKDFILKIMKKKPQQRMEIRQMLRHPFITKYQDVKLQMEIMKDIKQVLTG